MGKLHINKTDVNSSNITLIVGNVDDTSISAGAMLTPNFPSVQSIPTETIYIDRVVQKEIRVEVPVIQIVEKVIVREVPVTRDVIIYDEVKLARLEKEVKKQKRIKNWLLLALVLSLVLEIVIK